MNRALRHTVHGIADKIWKPLHDACAAVDVYYHVWETETAFVDTAARGGERMEVAVGDGAAEMVKLLRPFGARGMTEKQATFDAAFARNASSYAALDRRCLLYTSPSPRDKRQSRMPSSA